MMKSIEIIKSNKKVKSAVYALSAVTIIIVIFIWSVDKNLFGLFGASPQMNDLMNPVQMEASEMYSDDGKLIGRIYIENRSLITYDELSPILIETLVNTEDKRFYEHNGIDYYGLLAAIKDAVKGNARGASTISQQLVKNLFKVRTDYTNGFLCRVPIIKTLIIKIKECLGAIRIEERYTKDEILTMYFNTVYFGNRAYGIKMASHRYFGVLPKDLTYDQAAVIIGILKATTYYDPIRNPENNLKRRNTILRNLQDGKVLTSLKCDSLCSLPLGLNLQNAQNDRGDALYFREVVISEVQEWCEKNGFDIFSDGLKIYTSIDSRIQRHAESAVRVEMKKLQRSFSEQWKSENPWRDKNQKELKNFLLETMRKQNCYKSLMKIHNDEKIVLEKLSVPHPMKVFSYRGLIDTTMSSMDSLQYALRFLHASLLAMDPHSGKVKAWVGDVDFNYWQYDKVVSKRQPGSTFKLFVYATALKNGRCSCDEMVDSAVTWLVHDGEKTTLWQPRNASGTFTNESVSLKTAFARSINSVPVQLTRIMTPDSIVRTAHDMGVDSPLKPIPSIALGAEDVSLLEMVGAYAGVVDEGRWHKPVLVTKITDRNGRVLYRNDGEEKQPLDIETAFLLRDMLQEGLRDERGTSHRLNSFPVVYETDFGGKTGTTSNYSDAWYMGVTPNLVAGVWVGGEYRCIHFRNGAIGQASRTALPVYARFMEYILNDKHLEKIYKGRFPSPNLKKINKPYDCDVMVEEKSGNPNFFERLFQRKKRSELRDSIKEEKKKARKERREKRHERR